MRAFKALLLSCLILIPSSSSESVTPKISWTDRLSLALGEYLEKNGEIKIIQNSRKYTLTKEDLSKSCFYAWEAAGNNPSWWTDGKDGRKVATIKWICAHYGETSCNLYGVNVINPDGSLDLGAMQVNSVHWMGVGPKSMWGRYCERHKLDYKRVWSILNPRNNFRFAGELNEHFFKIGQRTYSFDGQDRQKKLYLFLLVRMGFRKEANQYVKEQELKRWKEEHQFLAKFLK